MNYQKIKLNSSAQPPFIMNLNIRLSMCGVVQERSFRIWFEISYFFSNLELCPIMSLFRGHTWRNILYWGQWKLIFQSWNESQKKKVFVRRAHVEEASTSSLLILYRGHWKLIFQSWIESQQNWRCPKFTFSSFTPDPDLHKSISARRFQKTQIYTTQLCTSPKFTQFFFFKFCSNYKWIPLSIPG